MPALLRALGSASPAVERPLPAAFGTCFMIPGLLDAAECAELVADAQARGFASANADYPPSYRDNERQVHDDPLLARWLFARLRRHLPQTLVDAQGETWRLVGLNERLRFCRYRTGQQFRIHQDGVHHRSRDERSMLTFMVYLDGPESFTGGDTVFYASGPAHDGAPAVVARVEPRRGSVIVFDHALWHAGEPLASGCKHIVRSDIVYERAEPRPHAPGHAGYVWTLQRLADGRVASGGRDRTIRLWSPDGTHHASLAGHAQSVLGLAEYAPGRLASVSRDRHLRLWRTDDGACLHDVVAHDAAALCVANVSHGRIATGGADGAVALWNRDAEALVRLRGHAGWVWSLATLDDDTLASASEDGTVKLWHLREATCMATLAGPHPLRAVAARAVGGGTTALAAGDEHGKVTVWTIDRGRIERTLAFRAHDAAVRRLRYLDDGRLASCGEDGRVRVWDGVAQVCEAMHTNFATDVAALSDGTLLSCGYDGEIRRHELQRLAHAHERNGDAVDRRAVESLDLRVAAGAIQRLAGERRDEFGATETFAGSGVLADVHDAPADAQARERRMRIHRADAGGVANGIEQGVVATGGMIAAVQGGAPAPPAATGDSAVALDDEVGAVDDELRIEAHDGVAGDDLRGREEGGLQSVDGETHEVAQGIEVVEPGEAMGERWHWWSITPYVFWIAYTLAQVVPLFYARSGGCR